MSVKESLQRLLEKMPDDRLTEVLRFAEFVAWAQEREEWRSFGRGQLARAYGPDEPEYTLSDARPELGA